MVFRSSSWHRRYLQPRPHACAQTSTPGTSRGGWGRCSYIRFQITSPSDTSKNRPSAGWTWVTSSQGCSLVTSFTMGFPWPSLRSLRLSFLSADHSASLIITFLQLFPYLENLLTHTPGSRDDNLPSQVSRTALHIHELLNLLSFDSASSQFVSHLTGLDPRFPSISGFNCNPPPAFRSTNCMKLLHRSSVLMSLSTSPSCESPSYSHHAHRSLPSRTY